MVARNPCNMELKNVHILFINNNVFFSLLFLNSSPKVTSQIAPELNFIRISSHVKVIGGYTHISIHIHAHLHTNSKVIPYAQGKSKRKKKAIPITGCRGL
jgi:hypothetical protein